MFKSKEGRCCSIWNHYPLQLFSLIYVKAFSTRNRMLLHQYFLRTQDQVFVRCNPNNLLKKIIRQVMWWSAISGPTRRPSNTLPKSWGLTTFPSGWISTIWVALHCRCNIWSMWCLCVCRFACACMCVCVFILKLWFILNLWWEQVSLNHLTIVVGMNEYLILLLDIYFIFGFRQETVWCHGSMLINYFNEDCHWDVFYDTLPMCLSFNFCVMYFDILLLWIGVGNQPFF